MLSTRICAVLIRFWALFRHSPALRMWAATSSKLAAAKWWAVGKAGKSVSVIWFTRSSVHWAERMVATKSWNGPLCFRAVLGLGYRFSRILRIAKVALVVKEFILRGQLAWVRGAVPAVWAAPAVPGHPH